MVYSWNDLQNLLLAQNGEVPSIIYDPIQLLRVRVITLMPMPL